MQHGYIMDAIYIITFSIRAIMVIYHILRDNLPSSNSLPYNAFTDAAAIHETNIAILAVLSNESGMTAPPWKLLHPLRKKGIKQPAWVHSGCDLFP